MPVSVFAVVHAGDDVAISWDAVVAMQHGNEVVVIFVRDVCQQAARTANLHPGLLQDHSFTAFAM
ncbi:hypothetical protein B9057_01285 [Aestuarium zhoushanense]|nr:hypothetical protein B9057_01285 [Aestuarium zhoushanense]